MSTDSKAQLLPCPFCGCKAHFEMDDDRWEWIECESCGMQGNRSASLMEDCKPKLAAAWNLRAPAALVVQGYKITEAQHVAAVKVLQRASGVDGLPQRMIDAILAAAPQPPEAAKDKPVDAVLQMLLEQKAKKDALIANGICPTCEGKGECGGQFTGGEWTCEECNGTGKAHRIGSKDT